MLNSHAVRAIKNRQTIITQDGDYPEIYKGFRIEYNENLQRYEGRGEVSYVASSWDKLKKLIDDFWAGKDKQSSSKTSDYRGYKVTDQIIKGFMIYKSGKSPNTYYAKNENGEEYEGTMEEIKKQIDTYWVKRDEDVMKQKTRDHGYTVSRIGDYKIIEGAGVDGGWWFAKEVRGKGKLETKKFKTRAQAEEHAIMSTDDSKTKDKSPRWRIKDDKMFKLRTAAKKMKDALVSVRQNMSTKKVEYKVGGQWKPIEGKVKTAYENEQIKYDYADGGYHYFTCEVKDSKTKDSTQYTISWMEDGGKESVTLPAVELLKYDANPRKAAVEYLAEKHPDGKVLNVTGDSTGAFIKGELETTDDLFYKGVYYKPQELHALLVKEGMTKKLNELTESEKRDRKGNAWPLYESNGGVFAVVN